MSTPSLSIGKGVDGMGERSGPPVSAPSRVSEEGVDRTGPMWLAGVVECVLAVGSAVVAGVDLVGVVGCGPAGLVG